MAVGQAVLSPSVGLSSWAAVSARLQAAEQVRSAQYSMQLQDALELLRLSRPEGLELSAPAELAMLLRCSEYRATELLTHAEFYAALPGGFDALGAGALTVEQARTLVQVLAGVQVAVRVQVWHALLAQLELDARSGVLRPPARLKELLNRLVQLVDPGAVVERKKSAAPDADVTYDKRDDGLVDVHAWGISSPEALAAFRSLAERAQAAGSWDDRPAGRRRLDALMDLLLGRQPLTVDGGAGAGCSGRGCGCPLGGGAGPCGAQLVVHVPLATALGVGDVPAELVGHGPIDPDELARLLLAAPALQAVFVDEHGVPVAAADEVLQPERGDRQAVRAALLDVARLRPGEYFPRHPDDHPGPPDPAPRPPGDDASSPTPPHRHLPPDPWAVLAAATLGTPLPEGLRHPPGRPRAYSIRPRLRRFLRLRAPRCEWPGCGARAARCDLDHDDAWPAGATCACNLGPLCRRHHRTKQGGWTKARQQDGSIRWTSPHGRSWTSPVQHRTPEPPTWLLPLITHDTGRLSPTALLEEQLLADPAGPRWTGLHTDPAWLSAEPDRDPQDDRDHLGYRIRNGDTAWDLDLLDPWAWTGEIPLPELE